MKKLILTCCLMFVWASGLFAQTMPVCSRFSYHNRTFILQGDLLGTGNLQLSEVDAQNNVLNYCTWQYEQNGISAVTADGNITEISNNQSRVYCCVIIVEDDLEIAQLDGNPVPIYKTASSGHLEDNTLPFMIATVGGGPALDIIIWPTVMRNSSLTTEKGLLSVVARILNDAAAQ